MKVSFLFALLLSAATLTAQTDSTAARFDQTHSTVTTLTRTEIERLPAGSFLDLIAAVFPFTRSEGTEANFSYVLNGFVLVDPNAVNLSQIESIRFFPEGTALTRGTLARKGTFVISTTPQQSGLSFSTKTGLWLPRNEKLTYVDINGKTSGLFSLNELAYRAVSQAGYLSSAVSFLRDKSPNYLYEYSTGSNEAQHTQNRLRLSNFGEYRLGRQLALQGSLFYTNQPEQTDVVLNILPTTTSSRRGQNKKSDFGSIQAGLRFASDRLTNFFSAEASLSKINDVQTDNFLSPGLPGVYTNIEKNNLTAYALSNAFAWKAVAAKNVTLEASVVARYRRSKVDENGRAEYLTGPGQTSFSEYSQKRTDRSLSVSPSLSLRLRDVLFVNGGFTYDDYETSLYGGNAAKKTLPHAGIRISLGSLLKGSGLDALELSSNYQQYVRGYEANNVLGAADVAVVFPAYGITGYDLEEAYRPRKNWTSSLALRGWNNRFGLKVSYRLLDRTLLTNLPVQSGGTFYGYYQGFEPVTSKGWGFELNGVPLQKQGKSLSLAVTLTRDEYEWAKNGGMASMPAEAVDQDPGKVPWRGGFRSSLSLHRFFVQASALLSFNELLFDDSGNAEVDMTGYNTNFLLAGYRWPLKGRAVKSLEASVQTRNLLGLHRYNATTFAGVGLSLTF